MQHTDKEGHNDLICSPAYVLVDDWDCMMGDWPEGIRKSPNISWSQARDILSKAVRDLEESYSPEYSI